MSLLSPRRGFHHDSGLPSIRQRSWAEGFARARSLRPSSSGIVGEERETTAQDGTKETSRPFLLRYYSVFNLSQTEGIDIPASLLQETRTNNPIETCEQIVANMPNPPAFEQSDKAWYSPSSDAVGMPARGLFHSSEEYYATVFHELAHSTGHAKRLHRENFDNPVSFGSESYSKEELIAEMTAAMLCGIAGIEQKTLENSAAYLKTWIERLKSDSRLLVSAASHAPKASRLYPKQSRVAGDESTGRLSGP